jgi:hypothetical protein
MVIPFTKTTTLVILIISFVVITVLKKYYYGGTTMLLGLFIGIRYALGEVIPAGDRSLLYASIPAYVVMVVHIVTSLWVLYKSKTVNLNQTIFTVSQLSVAIMIIVGIRYMKGIFPLLNESYIQFLPTLCFVGFVISVSIIKDNQDILRKTYSQARYDVKKATTNI